MAISAITRALQMACVLLLTSAAWASTHTVTKTIKITKTKHYTSTLTSIAIGTSATLIYGDNTDAGYPFPTDVSTTTSTSVPTSYLTTTETAQSRTTIDGTATTTVQPYGFTERPVQDTLPSAAYYYKDGGVDPVARLKARGAAPEQPKVLERGATTSPCTTVTTTLTKTKTVKTTKTKSTTSTFSSGTYITWSSESYGIPVSKYTSPVYTSTKTILTTDTTDGAAYLPTTVTTTIPGTTTLLSTTTTVYAACATSNFADSIALSDGTHPRIDRIANNIAGFVEKGPIPNTPTAYDCCVKVLYGGVSYIASAWVFMADSAACYYFEDNESVLCEESVTQWTNLTAFYGSNSAVPAVYGNGLCGSISANQYQLSG